MENKPKKFNFKKIGMSLLSLVLVFVLFISSFCLNVSAQSPLSSSLINKYPYYPVFAYGVNSSKNAFYNSTSLNNGYTYVQPNMTLFNYIREQVPNWNGYQSYFYLPATDTSVSGNYTWSGRIWTSTARNDNWQNQQLSSLYRAFDTLPKGYVFRVLVFFNLPNVNREFIGSNFDLSIYTTDYDSIISSGVNLVGIEHYTWSTPSPWDKSGSTGASRVGTHICLEFVYTAVDTVDMTSFEFSVNGVPIDYNGLLVDNFVVLGCILSPEMAAVYDQLDNVNNSIQSGVQDNRNFFERAIDFFSNFFTNIGTFFDNLWNNISQKFNDVIDIIGGFFSYVSDVVVNVVIGAIRSFGNIILALNELALVQEGRPLPDV